MERCRISRALRYVPLDDAPLNQGCALAILEHRLNLAADLHILPTLWFRNTWSWGRDDRLPALRASSDLAGHCLTIQASHRGLGDYKLHCEGARDLLFTDNETNSERLFSSPNKQP